MCHNPIVHMMYVDWNSACDYPHNIIYQYIKLELWATIKSCMDIPLISKREWDPVSFWGRPYYFVQIWFLLRSPQIYHWSFGCWIYDIHCLLWITSLIIFFSVLYTSIGLFVKNTSCLIVQHQNFNYADVMHLKRCWLHLDHKSIHWNCRMIDNVAKIIIILKQRACMI